VVSFKRLFRKLGLGSEVIQATSPPTPKPADKDQPRSFWDIRASVGEYLSSVLAKLPTIEPPDFFEDPLVREAWKHLVKPTPENLKFCFDHEQSIQKITKLLSETIVGAGWEITDGDVEAKNTIQDLYEERLNMSEFLEIGTSNLVMWGNSLWVPKFEGREFERIDSLDWRTIETFRDPLTGRMVFIQKVMVPSALFTIEDDEIIPISDEEWLELVKDPIKLKAAMAETQLKYFTILPRDSMFIKIRSRGFPTGRSPMEPILTDIVYKKLLEWNMCLSYELWGSPMLIGRTGVGITPERLVGMMRKPEDWASYQKRISDFADLLMKFRQFRVWSLAADQELDVKFPGRGIVPFIEVFEYFNREIMGCMLGSTALFEARGTELATSRTIKSVWDQAVDGYRRTWEFALNMQLHPLYLRKTGVRGKAKIRFKRMEIPEEILVRLMEIPREERRRLERLTGRAMP